MARSKGRTGIFIGLPPDQLAQLQTTAMNWLMNGQLESSTLNSSQFKKIFMDPQDMLLEVQYAQNLALSSPLPTRTKASFNWKNCNGGANGQAFYWD